jgi:hypothetical protein
MLSPSRERLLHPYPREAQYHPSSLRLAARNVHQPTLEAILDSPMTTHMSETTRDGDEIDHLHQDLINASFAYRILIYLHTWFAASAKIATLLPPKDHCPPTPPSRIKV